MTPATCTPASGATGLPDDSACSGHEVFALRVIGTDMAPEFLDGEIIVVEPGGAVRDGSYVLAQVAGEWLFRQLCGHDGSWRLRALHPDCRDHADVALPDKYLKRLWRFHVQTPRQRSLVTPSAFPRREDRPIV